MTTIDILVRADTDADDCLASAQEEYVADHPEAEGYDLDPRWEGGDDGDREFIVLSVPVEVTP